MEELNGMTPFEVTQEFGFPCHVSQRGTWFNRWIYGGDTITKASQIETYSPCLYGLYRSTVGPGTGLNDMFENVTPYGQQVEPEPVPEETETIPPEQTEPPTDAPVPPMQNPVPAVPKQQPELWIVGAAVIVIYVIVGTLVVKLGKKIKKQH